MGCPSSDGKEVVAQAYRIAMQTLGKPVNVPDIELTKCLIAGILDLAKTGESDPVHLARYAVLRCQLLANAKAIPTAGGSAGEDQRLSGERRAPYLVGE